jgi:hypothetical protein
LGEKQKKKTYSLQLNDIKESDDPTKLHCTFIIIDFDVSHNGTLISKEDAMNSLAPTIINKPIVTKYVRVQEPNDGTDHLEGHNAYLSEDRNGEIQIEMDTTPIGVFTTEGYILTINTLNGEKEVLAADAILWKDRFPDACDLLLEWYSRGININTSCEILYKNYIVKDGIEYIQSPIYFSGHCILNSEERGDYPVVLPAYDTSKLLSFNQIREFQRLVAQAIKQEVNSKEGEKMEKFKKVFELSHNDIRSLLYEQLDPTLPEGAYSWIADVYDSYFIVELYNEDEGYKYYKFNYSKTEETVTIDFDSKTEVTLKRDWIEVTEVQQMEQQLNEANQKIDDLQKQLSEAQSKLETLSTEKELFEKKFNEASDKLVALNSQIEELKPFKEKYEQEQYEKALNDKKSYYETKFKAFNALDKFESEEVQELIEKAVHENEEGKEAILKLNSMLVEMVNLEEVKETSAIREMASKRKDLIPENDDFDSRYSI